MSEAFRLLLVEDNLGDVRLIQEYLKKIPMMNVELSVVNTLEKAKKMLEEGNYDLVLLDLGLPDSDGLDTLAQMSSQSPIVPVIVLTGLTDNKQAIEAIKRGAQDYLIKDLINSDVLYRSIRYSIQRKQSQVKVEENEIKYRSLWDNSINGLAYHKVLTDDAGKPIDSIFLDVNTSFEKITGKRKEDIVGKRYSEVTDKMFPDSLAPEDTLWKVAITGRPMSFEIHNQKSSRWFSISVYSPLRGTFVSAIQDISERKNSESRIIEEKDRAQSYLEIAGVIFLALDDNGNITMMNQKASEILCCEPHDYIGKNWVESFIPEKQRKEVSNIYAKLMRGEIDNLKSYENTVITLNGEERIISWNNRLLTDSNGQIIGTLSSGEDITAQKTVEESLRESEQRNKMIVDTMSDLVLVHDSEGRYVDYFGKSEALLVRPWDEMKGKKIEEIVPPDIAAQYHEKAKKVRKTGESITYDFELEFDGSPRWLESTTMLHEDGKSIVVAVKDITERKMAEKFLSESEERLKLAGKVAYDLIYEWDVRSDSLEWFGNIDKILGFKEGEISGNIEDWINLIHPEDRFKLEEAVELHRTSTESINYDYRIKHKDETFRYWNDRALPLLDDEGKPYKWVGVCTDITIGKLAEENLKQSEEKFRVLYEKLSDALFLSDKEGRITLCNDMATELFGYEREELIGMHFTNLLHREWQERILDSHEEHLKTGKPVTGGFEAKACRKDGTHFDIHISNTILMEDGVPIGYQSLIRDISERKKTAESLKNSEERQRLVLSSMGDLIFVIDKNNNYSEYYASGKIAPFVPPDEFLGKNVRDIMPPEVAKRIIESANLVRKTGNQQTLEYSLIQDNNEEWFLSALDLHYDGESIVLVARNITSMKRAETEAKERDRIYRALISNIPGAVYHCAFDKHRTMFFLSEAFEDISGYSSADFIMNRTKSFASIIHPDDREFVIEEIAKSMDKHEGYRLEYRIIDKNGANCWIREYGKDIVGSVDEIGYLDGILFDVTEEKLAHDEMTRLKEIQQASFELSLALGETLDLSKIYEIVYRHIEQVMDTSIFIVSYFDKKTKQITAGYVITDEGSIDVQNFPPISLEDEGMGTQSQVIRSGESLYLPDLRASLEKTKTEYTIRSKSTIKEGPPPDDGKQRSKSAMFVPLQHHNEVIGVMQVQSYEINAYSQTQLDLLSNLANVVALAVQNAKLFQSVEESEDRFRLLVDGTLDGVFIHSDFILLELNQRMADMIGSERENLIGTNVIDFWTLESQELIREYISSNSESLLELDLLRIDGSIYRVETLGKDCLYKGRKARIVATRNITEEQKAQQETKQAADTALLYLDIMSHDFRNQIQAIIMASEIMQHTELDVENMLALEIITESVDKSQQLINKVVSTRELLSAPLLEYSLKTALETSIEMLRKSFDDIGIKTKFPREDTLVIGDKFIEQSILNILENAVEFNETIDRKLWIEIEELGQGYQVSIKDNGQGISDAKKESLFDPSRRFGGIGIHQTIRILQKYGGHISVHDRDPSDYSQGTEFRLWFPKAT